MICKNCGKEIRDGVKFCNYCGTPQNASDPKNSDRETEPIKERPRPKQAPEPGSSAGESGGRGTGLSLAAKVLIPIAIAAVAAACIFAAHSLTTARMESAEATEMNEDNEKDSKKGESVKAEEAEAEKSEAETETVSEEAAAEAAEVSSAEVSGGGITEQEAARQVIAALKRPSFFDRTSENYTLSIQPSVPEYTLENGLANVSNVDDFYLTDELKATLQENGFVVEASGGQSEFFSLYEENRYTLLPSFVTVDSMMHSYHLYFSYLLRTTEKNYLKDLMGELSLGMFTNSLEQLNALAGTEWEEAALRNVAFFAVGCRLAGLDASVPAEAAEVVEEEYAMVLDAEKIDMSPLFGDFEDYSQYAPRGYYEGDDNLEAYFRMMMWYGRRNFPQKDESMDRSALLITMALDDETLSLWEEAYMITSFFAGVSDDNGYYEYRPVIDEFFGADAGTADLAGAAEAWAAYHEYTAGLKAPVINSVPGIDTNGEVDLREVNAGFRFMGQRFSLDAAIFQNLMYSDISAASDGSKRMLPNALDIPAVMGSDEALTILKDLGEDKYPNYLDTVEELRSGMTMAPESIWSTSLYSRWLYTLQPLLETKGDGWPMFMQSNLWQRKNLQTFLGSYTELKHDTVLYAKQAIAEMGGAPFDNKDDRGYVEPEAEVYARLSVLTEATINGLSDYQLLSDTDRENLERLKYLADAFTVISEKELQNETLSDSEYELIRSYGGQIEHLWMEAYKDETEKPNTFEFPAAVVTDVATDPNGSCLEVGTGRALTIYVAVPVAGQLKICRGTVFSFYQFSQPLSDRLTDNSWRMMMGIYHDSSNPGAANPRPLEAWTNEFAIIRQ